MKNWLKVFMVYAVLAGIILTLSLTTGSLEAQQSRSSIDMVRAYAADFTGWNPTLPIGTMGFEIDTRKFKIGDGNTSWTSLSYVNVAPGTDTPTLGSLTLTTPLAVASGGTGVTSRFTTTTVSAPTYTGQLAIVGGNAYIATSNTATTDWKQINN